MFQVGQQCRVDAIEVPGAYLCHWNGDLLRVVRDSDSQGVDENIPPPGDGQPPMVTLLSLDPHMPLSIVRMTAANLNLEVQC